MKDVPAFLLSVQQLVEDAFAMNLMQKQEF